MAAIIPADIKKVVCFLFAKAQPPEPLGTGFWVAVPARNKAETMFSYIVTAKHVVENKGCVFARLNLTSPDQPSGFANIDLASGNHRPILHSNPAVDIAVIPFAPPEDAGVDFKVIQKDMFALSDYRRDQSVSEGDEVFFTGLMPQVYGKLKNTPVVRYGRIALVTDEPFATDQGEAEYLYVEANSYPGNSGSPVFLRFGPTRKAGTITLGGDRIMLLGVMHGYLHQGRLLDQVDVATASKTLAFLENINIAMVCPVDYLAEILDSPEAKKRRGDPT